MKTRKPTGQRGSTMIVTLILMFATTALTIAGLSAASSNLKVARNYRTATQAMLAAEAGQVHAHERISDWGVIRFNRDVVPRWDEILGTGWQEVEGFPGVRYAASVSEDPTDPLGHVILTTVGQAPNESTRTITSRLEVDLYFSPGTIYLPGGNVDSEFHGNSFLVDGFDRNLDGTPNPEGNVPGITTRDEDSRDEVRSELNGEQRNNVIGDGSGIPAVEMSYGPTADRIQNEIVPNILDQQVVRTDPVPSGIINGNYTFGTIHHPQITHFTGNVTIRANGNATGAGILVIDGGLTINGSLDFTGLIIVRGTTEITSVSGAAVVLGAIWTTSIDLNVAGNASVTYSSQALELAASIADELLPQRARANSWEES